MRVSIYLLSSLVLLTLGCRKANILTLPINEEYTGTAEIEWNGLLIDDLRVRALYNQFDYDYASVQADRLVGAFNQMDIGLSISGVFLETPVGDTLYVKPEGRLMLERDSVHASLGILEGDVSLESYELNTNHPAWVILEHWDPVTEEIEIRMSMVFRRLERENRPVIHPLANDEVRITNATMRGTVLDLLDN
ncbi:MAG: hypothetical protein AAF828_01130 [Bacteroidota bacterium]